MFSWHGAAFPRVRNSKRWKCHCPLWCSFWSHTSLLLQYSMGHTVHPWFRERRDYIRAWIPRVEDHWGLTRMLTTREKTKWSTRTRPLHGHEQMESSTKAEGIVLVRCTERSSVATIFRCNCRRVGRSGGSWSIFSSIFFFFPASRWDRKQGHRSRMRTGKEVLEVHISSFSASLKWYSGYILLLASSY